MANPYAEHTQAKATERIADALERIATAVEAQAAADPLTMLSMALEDEGEHAAGAMTTMTPTLAGALSGASAEPQAPVASNGYTVLYRHPDEQSGLEIVARRDEAVPGRWRVEVEPK